EGPRVRGSRRARPPGEPPTHHPETPARERSGPMPRACFHLQVRPDSIDEDRTRHAAVWPEMLRARHETGWHNYSLFLRADGLLIGYVETPSSIAEAQAAMARTEVNARWQAEMAGFFVELDGRAPDE